MDLFTTKADEKIAALQAEVDELKNNQTAKAINALIKLMKSEVDELVEMLEALKHNAIREDANTDQDIGIWIARFSDEGMASLKILIDKHRRE